MEIETNPNQRPSLLFSSVYYSLLSHIKKKFYKDHASNNYCYQNINGNNKTINILYFFSLQKLNVENKNFEVFYFLQFLFYSLWIMVFITNVVFLKVGLESFHELFNPSESIEANGSNGLSLMAVTYLLINLFINILSYWRWGLFLRNDHFKIIFRRIWLFLFFVLYILGMIFFIFMIIGNIETTNHFQIYVNFRLNIIVLFIILNILFYIPALNILFMVGLDILVEINKIFIRIISFFQKILDSDNIKKAEQILEEDIENIYQPNLDFKILNLGISEIKLIEDITKLDKEDIDKKITPLVIIFSFFAIFSNTPSFTNFFENMLNKIKLIFIYGEFSKQITISEYFIGIIISVIVIIIFLFFINILILYAVKLKIYGILLTTCHIAIFKLRISEDQNQKEPLNLFSKISHLLNSIFKH